MGPLTLDAVSIQAGDSPWILCGVNERLNRESLPWQHNDMIIQGGLRHALCLKHTLG